MSELIDLWWEFNEKEMPKCSPFEIMDNFERVYLDVDNIALDDPPKLEIEDIKYVSPEQFLHSRLKASSNTSGRNIEIIELWFYNDLTLQQCGDEYGISRERIRQIISKCGIDVKGIKQEYKMLCYKDFMVNKGFANTIAQMVISCKYTFSEVNDKYKQEIRTLYGQKEQITKLETIYDISISDLFRMRNDIIGYPCKCGEISTEKRSWGSGNLSFFPCSSCYTEVMRETRKTYYENNKKMFKESNKKYQETDAFKEKFKRTQRYRKLFDYDYQMSSAIRSMLTRVYNSYGTEDEISYSENAIGYNRDQLKTHLESLFENEYSWENRSEWHIDHIVPVSWFINNQIYDPKIINCLDNLRPLWVFDNISKHDKLDQDGIDLIKSGKLGEEVLAIYLDIVDN